jgi:hypothetical protein
MTVFKTISNPGARMSTGGRIMKRTARFLAALAAFAAIAAAARAQDASTARSEIASRGYLLGRWHCTFTVGSDGGAYTTTWANVLDGVWLRQTYDQRKQSRAFPFEAEYLVGYDENHRQWVRFGAMTTGQYFAIRMTDDGHGGWGWKYVSFFRRKKPESPGYDATLTRTSDVEYHVDGPTYPNEKGAMVTEHHVCRKS